MSFPDLSIVILAAGDSRRLGYAKQLLVYHGDPLVRRAADNAASLHPAEVLVITGAGHSDVVPALDGSSARTVHNPHWRRGMGNSIAAGVAASRAEASGLMILLCDQWRIEPADLRYLATTWASDATRIVAAGFQNRQGPPVVFPSSCFDALARLDADGGAKEILASRRDLLEVIPIDNAAYDLDTPAHYEEMQARR